MATVTRSFTLTAWVLGTRWRHHRLHDHYGADSDDFVMLSRKIGPYEEQTAVHAVLEDLVARIYRLETSEVQRLAFTLDAWLSRDTVVIGVPFNAVIAGVPAHSFTLDAWKVRGARFTLDAVVRGGGRFTLYAIVA